MLDDVAIAVNNLGYSNDHRSFLLGIRSPIGIRKVWATSNSLIRNPNGRDIMGHEVKKWDKFNLIKYFRI